MKFTVIYTHHDTVGSHQQVTVRMKYITASSVQAAYDKMDGTAVFVFGGHIKPEVVSAAVRKQKPLDRDHAGFVVHPNALAKTKPAKDEAAF